MAAVLRGERIEILIYSADGNLLDVIDQLDLLCWFDNRATLGCNVYRELDDYSYIWDLVKKYHLKRK